MEYNNTWSNISAYMQYISLVSLAAFQIIPKSHIALFIWLSKFLRLVLWLVTLLYPIDHCALWLFWNFKIFVWRIPLLDYYEYLPMPASMIPPYLLHKFAHHIFSIIPVTLWYIKCTQIHCTYPYYLDISTAHDWLIVVGWSLSIFHNGWLCAINY